MDDDFFNFKLPAALLQAAQRVFMQGRFTHFLALVDDMMDEMERHSFARDEVYALGYILGGLYGKLRERLQQLEGK